MKPCIIVTITNKSFIDKILRFRDGWVLDSVIFCLFIDLEFVSVRKNAKKTLGQCQAILTSQLVNNPYLFLHREKKRENERM